MKKQITSEKIPIKLWLDDIDEVTLQQAKDLANFPFAYKHIAIMPDAHPGFGMPIGGVLATLGVVIPNAVGVDIGCGMEAVKTSITNISQDTLKNILCETRNTIPVGFEHNKEAQIWEAFNRAPSVDIIQKEIESAKRQIGTLGGGNHFIEILKGDDGFIWILVHSGSRNFGFKTANYFYQKAIKISQNSKIKLPTKELSFLPIDSNEGRQYLKAMNFCLEFAQANRDLMTEKVKKIFSGYTKATFDPSINIHHNYAAEEEHFAKKVYVHRKGATKATKGLIGIVPGSMGTPSYIVEGLGNPESFCSCSHGAGRRLGRRQAIKSLSLEEEQIKMKDILGAPRTKNELQEAPGAYKDIDKVMKDQEDLVKIKTKLFPLAVIIGT